MIFKRGLPFVLTGLSLVIASVYYFSPLALIGQERVEISRPVFDSIIDPVFETVGSGMPVQLSSQVDIKEAKEGLYQAVNGEINKRSQPYKNFFPIGLSIGIFFALKVVGVPFMWLVILAAILVFRIMILTEAIHIQQKSVLREVIES